MAAYSQNTNCREASAMAPANVSASFFSAKHGGTVYAVLIFIAHRLLAGANKPGACGAAV